MKLNNVGPWWSFSGQNARLKLPQSQFSSFLNVKLYQNYLKRTTMKLSWDIFSINFVNSKQKFQWHFNTFILSCRNGINCIRLWLRLIVRYVMWASERKHVGSSNCVRVGAWWVPMSMVDSAYDWMFCLRVRHTYEWYVCVWRCTCWSVCIWVCSSRWV